MSMKCVALLSAGVVSVLTTLLAALPMGALADEKPSGCVKDDATGEWYCPVEAHKGGGPAGSTPGKKSKRTPTCTRLIENPIDPGHEVPCSGKDGLWIQERQCYAKPKVPQPGKDDPVWGDHTNGAVYSCITDIPYYRNETIWLENPPRRRVDPEVLARSAVELMRLRQVTIGMAPKPGSEGLGFVGLPTYMWVADAGPSTTGPSSKSATAGDVTVTATAHVERIVWTMGDGATVTCTGPGTPYQDSFGSAPSPTCGHTYRRASTGMPGGAYSVTATAYWHVDWVGGGENGFFEFSFPSATTVRIGEAQALN